MQKSGRSHFKNKTLLSTEISVLSKVFIFSHFSDFLKNEKNTCQYTQKIHLLFVKTVQEMENIRKSCNYSSNMVKFRTVVRKKDFKLYIYENERKEPQAVVV